MGNNNHFSFLVFDQSGHMVQTEFEDFRLIFVFGGFFVNLVLGFFQKSGFLFLFGFRGVFLQKFEKRLSLVTVHGTSELIQSWGNIFFNIFFI